VQLSFVAIFAAMVLVSLASLGFHGRVTYDYVITGAVTALLVSYAINSIVGAHVNELEYHVEHRTAELVAANTRLSDEIETRRRYEVELIDAKRAIESANQIKSEFLLNLSHELRTPLNIIIGLSETLQESPLPEEERSWVESIRGSAFDLLAMIEDVLHVAHFDHPGEEPDVEVDVRSMVEFALRPIAERAAKKGLTIAAIVAAGTPTRVTFAAERCRQVLSRLLGNALKFTASGGITLRVDLAGDHGHERLRVEVHDTGIGVPEDLRARIFEPFVQGDGSTRRIHGGVGLGLTIARQLTEQMGGELGLISELGRGSVFWFTVPIRRASEPSASTTGGSA
jgi:signal transduction histidine kinase